MKSSKLLKYPPSLFHSNDVKEAFHIASKAKFASIFLTHQPQTDILFAPFFNLYEKDSQPTHYAHLVKSNPIFELLKEKKQLPCRLLFQQTDMYISPIAYEQKTISHRVVPTWNYVSVQFKGTIKFSHENNLRELLEKEVQIFQTDVQSKWRLSDAPNDYIDVLIKSIFGIRVDVTEWKVHKKLSQNKSQSQFNNVRKWCEGQISRQKTIVDWMNYYDIATPQKKN